jgi:hypothetical protein
MSSAQSISPEVLEYLDQVVSKLPDSSWSFLQGFLLGQLWIVILVLAFIKYMLLEDVKKHNPKVLIHLIFFYFILVKLNKLE